MDALRKVYHRAVQIPLENVETLWSELEAFENGLNRVVVSISNFVPSQPTLNSTSYTLGKEAHV
jgi:hypothetical protein